MRVIFEILKACKDKFCVLRPFRYFQGRANLKFDIGNKVVNKFRRKYVQREEFTSYTVNRSVFLLHKVCTYIAKLR